MEGPSGFTAVLGGLSRPLELPGWEDANLPPCNEILFKKDFRFSHDPWTKVWAVFKHKSRNSQNVSAVFFLTVLGRRGGDDGGEGLGYKSSLAAAGGSARAECRAGRLLPAFPCLALVSHPSLLQNASCSEACPMQRPAAGQGLQMSLPRESCPSACFKGFEPHSRCRNPVTVHASSPQDRFFYKSCHMVHFHRPNTGRGEVPERHVSLAFRPCRAPLWYFTVNLTPFLKQQQFCTDPKYCVVGGGSPCVWGTAGMSRQVFFLEFLPGELLQLCYCSKDVNKFFLLLIPVLVVSVCELHLISAES